VAASEPASARPRRKPSAVRAGSAGKSSAQAGGRPAAAQPPRLAVAFLAVAGLIAGLGLGSHLLGVDLLDPLFPQPTPFKGNTAIAMACAAAGVALDGRRAGRALGALAAGIGAVTLIEYLVPIGSAFDELIFDEFSPQPEAGPHPGRMAPNTAAAFVLIGGALALRSRAAVVPAVLALAIGLMGIVGYTDADAESLARLGRFVRIALPTAIGVALVAGALILRRERGWFERSSVGGTVVRRFGPLALVIPVITGSLWLAAREAGLFSEGVGVWLFTLVNLLVVALAVYVLSVVLDRVERRNASALAQQAAELRRALEEIERSNHELEQFASVASHDLSEPLRVVGGFVGLLKQRYSGRLDADADAFIDAATAGVERMQAMIDALLGYSRVGSREFEPRPVDCNEVVAEAVTGLDALIEERGARIAVDPLPTVPGEPTLLGLLFQNLVSNAVKFTVDRVPEVRVSAAAGDGVWTFAVTDNGPGIEPEGRERIFEMFGRLHSREMPGTGIGLAVCKRIAERHGGDIAVEAAADGGSVFLFTVADPAATRA
jgi:signal transduction histidine kinase